MINFSLSYFYVFTIENLKTQLKAKKLSLKSWDKATQDNFKMWFGTTSEEAKAQILT